MWIPLAVLAVLSLVGGYINIPKWLEPMFKLAPEESGIPWTAMVSVAAGLIGIALAAWFYLIAPAIPEGLARTFSTPYRWIYNKYFVDEFYDSLVVNPTVDGSRSLLWRVVDAGGIDGIVNGAGKTARNVGGVLKRMQSGSIRSYAAWVVLGLDRSDRSHHHGRRRPMTLLDAVLFLPLIGFLLLLLIPKSNPGLSRMAALVISLVIFVLSLGLASGLVAQTATPSSTIPNGSARRPSAITSASTA